MINSLFNINETKKKTDMETKTEKTKQVTLYQPMCYSDDGTNIDYTMPIELNSFDVFLSEEECEYWLAENGYDLDDCIINEYKEDDIEDYNVIE